MLPIPAILADFARAASAELPRHHVQAKTTIATPAGEPATVLWVVEPYRPSDISIENPISHDVELLVQAIYHAVGMGRYCVPAVLAPDVDAAGDTSAPEHRCIVRRIHSDWVPFAHLAEARGDRWAVDLPAPLLRRDAARIALLDYLLGNPNRHAYSLLLDLEGRRLIAGDHGACLGVSGPPYEDSWTKGPIGDLGLERGEMDEALSWWEGARWAVEPILAVRPLALEQVRVRYLDLLSV